MSGHANHIGTAKRAWRLPWLQPKAFVLLTLLVCLFGGAAPGWMSGSMTPKLTDPGASVSGRVTHVRDGDTIEIGAVPIRLQNLNCAERGTVRGAQAKQHMRALVHREHLTCALNGRKTYDRFVGTCRFSDGRDLAQAMIKGGICAQWR